MKKAHIVLVDKCVLFSDGARLLISEPSRATSAASSLVITTIGSSRNVRGAYQRKQTYCSERENTALYLGCESLKNMLPRVTIWLLSAVFYTFCDFNYYFAVSPINLRFGEIIKYRSVDSTVGFVYNIVTSSGT